MEQTHEEEMRELSESLLGLRESLIMGMRHGVSVSMDTAFDHICMCIEDMSYIFKCYQNDEMVGYCEDALNVLDLDIPPNQPELQALCSYVYGYAYGLIGEDPPMN